MKILNLIPDQGGGIESYYDKLGRHPGMVADYFIVGMRPGEQGVPGRIRRLFSDYSRFAKLLRDEHYGVVMVNPSLDLKGIIRDGLFLLLARMNKRKTIVFFHGWLKSVEVIIETRCLGMFRYIYGRTNAAIVLSLEIKTLLRSWGFLQPIHLEVMTIEDELMTEFDVRKAIAGRMEDGRWRILFLARILKQKGIYETIEALSLLQSRYPTIDLLIAGEGEELPKVKAFVAKHAVPNITFYGYVTGKSKQALFLNAHCYCLPSYTEGMPNSVIEAMAYGLPVVTTLVGGLVDFFESGKHGFASKSPEPAVIAGSIEELITDKELYERISITNHEYAKSRFLTSHAALRLQRIFESVLHT
jgi:glycosyltransferase involved in cell wall biosynthesis